MNTFDVETTFNTLTNNIILNCLLYVHTFSISLSIKSRSLILQKLLALIKRFSLQTVSVALS